MDVPAVTLYSISDGFRTFSCRSGTPGRFQDAIQTEDLVVRVSEQGSVPLPAVFKHLQPEEQPPLASQVRVRAAAEVRLSLLRVHLEEVVQCTCPRGQETQRLTSRRNTCAPREYFLIPLRKVPPPSARLVSQQFILLNRKIL